MAASKGGHDKGIGGNIRVIKFREMAAAIRWTNRKKFCTTASMAAPKSRLRERCLDNYLWLFYETNPICDASGQAAAGCIA